MGWVKADTKAIQAIHEHVITHNPRVTVSHSDLNTWNLHIKSVTEEDRGGYMCQLNTDPMKSQVSKNQLINQSINTNIIAQSYLITTKIAHTPLHTVKLFPRNQVTHTFVSVKSSKWIATQANCPRGYTRTSCIFICIKLPSHLNQFANE